jgi:hypothetical protein
MKHLPHNYFLVTGEFYLDIALSYIMYLRLYFSARVNYIVMNFDKNYYPVFT